MNKQYKLLIEFLSGKKSHDMCGKITLQVVIKKVINIIAENIGVKEEKIKLETVYRNLRTDSLDDIQIIMDLEEEFGFDIPDSDAKNFEAMGELTIKDIVDYICKKLNER